MLINWRNIYFHYWIITMLWLLLPSEEDWLTVDTNSLPLFNQAWCTPCYQHKPGRSFLLYQESDPYTFTSHNEDSTYSQARPCDALCYPFEFDECSFYRLKDSPSQHDNNTNKNLLEYILRTNLDSFCYHTQWTLYHLTRMFSEEVTTGQNMGF